MTLTSERLAEIGKLAGAATGSPWFAESNAYGVWFVSGGDQKTSPMGVPYHDLICGGNDHDTLTADDAAFIAALDPATVLSLVAGYQGEVTVSEEMIARAAEAVRRNLDDRSGFDTSGLDAETRADLLTSVARDAITSALAKKE